MRKLVTILLILVSLNSYTQVLDSIPNTTETERIIDKYSDNIISGFNTVIEKVTPLAEDGFKVVVKLKFIQGIALIIGAVICLLLIIVSFKKNIKDFIMHNTAGALYMVLLYPLIGLFIMGYAGLMRIFVPEWFAIKEIIGLF